MSPYRKRLAWQLLLALGLLALSALLYLAHYAIFRDARHIFIYLLGDIAFVPVEVLLGTLVIHHLLSKREKDALLQKMNMVIGAFFSEVGTRLLEYFAGFDPDSKKLGARLIVTDKWSKQDFARVRRQFENYSCKVISQRGDLEGVRDFLLQKRNFLLGLLENPNLLEHETFTNLLWAVFHLTEELAQRGSVKSLPKSDYEHLSGDLERVYSLLILEWLAYMQHLREAYPYLFSLAMRTNPFDPEAKVQVG